MYAYMYNEVPFTYYMYMYIGVYVPFLWTFSLNNQNFMNTVSSQTNNTVKKNMLKKSLVAGKTKTT